MDINGERALVWMFMVEAKSVIEQPQKISGFMPSADLGGSIVTAKLAVLPFCF
ncbi:MULTISPECIES: hypothetical protein [unclassified Phyllobacterium]|uniref:hypothetical protein n=1 Tax=unclassified Phyllobacterium TaxID=2638441 RepID=UPI0030130DF7